MEWLERAYKFQFGFRSSGNVYIYIHIYIHHILESLYTIHLYMITIYNYYTPYIYSVANICRHNAKTCNVNQLFWDGL